MIYVCDAIMGTGKSQSAIAYMNANPERRFIYITPFVDEAARIRESCPALHFIEPQDKIPRFGFTKCGHTNFLVESGRNVATTHQAFKFYTQRTLDAIREHGYTLIIDESLNVLDRFKYHCDDIELAISGGYVRDAGDRYELSEDGYCGRAIAPIVRLLRSRYLYKGVDRRTASPIYYWGLPGDFLEAFDDIFILTYLFEGSSLYHFL